MMLTLFKPTANLVHPSKSLYDNLDQYVYHKMDGAAFGHEFDTHDMNEFYRTIKYLSSKSVFRVTAHETEKDLTSLQRFLG